MLTLISKDECEYTEDRNTVLGKYTKQTDSVRVVLPVMGTSQVFYYRITDQGLQDNDGNVLLTAEQYAAAIEAQRQALQLQQNEKTMSVQETLTNSTFPLEPIYDKSRNSLTPDNIVITDASLKFHTSKLDPSGYYQYTVPEKNDTVYFTQIGDISQPNNRGPYTEVLIHVRQLDATSDMGTYYYVQFACKSEADARTVFEAVTSSFEAWKKKFPTEVLTGGKVF